MSGPSVYFTFPTTFQPWPEALPEALPPPVNEGSFRSPFGINKDLYNGALSPEIPFTFAAVYIVSVFALNAYNRKRNWKPWAIATQKPFQWFVVVHNVLLTLYSVATFLAMFRAAAQSLPAWGDPNGAAGVADALCKLHGPRGLGDATTFNSTINIWEAKNSIIKLGYDGTPDPTDVGRIWNEGLAFWGWWFYISKFYEVLDTLIILAKGRRSATLQTYHHAGAMLCMWSGMRYMSPPIWMFVIVNSFIHALMYAYFTASALGYKVRKDLKRALTSLQIAQFIWGSSYATAHLFVAYDIPISTPYQIVSTVQRAVSTVSSAASSVSSDVSAFIASPTATASLGALIKKLLLRAAGEEGVAERIRHQPHGAIPTPYLPQKLADKIDHFNEQVYETRWRTDWTRVNCIDTTGQAFAIYLNLLYLLPLTWLFGKFFVRAYSSRGKPQSVSEAAKQAADSAIEGKQQTEGTVEDIGDRIEDGVKRTGETVKRETRDLHEQLREDVKQMKAGKFRDRPVSDRVASFERQVKPEVEKAKDKVKAALDGVSSPSRGRSGKQGDDSREDEPAGLSDQKESAAETGKEEQETAGKRDGDLEETAGGADEVEDEDKENQPPAGKEIAGQSKEREGESKPDASSESKPEQKVESSQFGGADSDSSKKQDANDKQSSNEPKAKQDEIIEGSKPLRPGAPLDSAANEKAKSTDKPSNDKKGSKPDVSGSKAKAESSEKKIVKPQPNEKSKNPKSNEPQRKGETGEKKPSPQAASGKNEKSKSGAEKAAAGQKVDTKNDKPEPNDEDTDAMGKSGSIIDLAAEKAKNAAPATGGGQRKPPGSAGA